MADIRFKDLTTTASSTASDDFIAVDGTTNGTRKLSAFSPTFGGNATVTGTLTVNGLLTAAATTSLDGLPTAAIFGATKRIAIGYNTSGDYGFIASADSGTTWKELHLNPSGGLVKVPSTSASTTTSTGALVVGNGTSGGLGVGGAVNIGGTLSVLDGGTVSSAGTIRLSNNTSIGWRNAANSADIFLTVNNSNIFAFGSGAPVYVNNSTASTSTSSGALVVNGGVGVAGAIYLGGILVSSGSSAGLAAESRDGSGYRTTWYNPTGDDMQLDFAGIGTKFTITSAGNTTIAGTLGVGGATVASRLHVYESTSGTGDSNGITIEQASTADAALQFLLTGTQRWTVGIDNSDSDKFKIGTGAIGAADRLTIDTSGNLSIPATTASTSISSGALVVSGGVGITGNAYVGGRLMVVGGIDNTIAGNVEFSTGQIRVTNAYTATSATAAGAVGSITWDNLYIYVCVATNTWKRVAISSW